MGSHTSGAAAWNLFRYSDEMEVEHVCCSIEISIVLNSKYIYILHYIIEFLVTKKSVIFLKPAKYFNFQFTKCWVGNICV